MNYSLHNPTTIQSVLHYGAEKLRDIAITQSDLEYLLAHILQTSRSYLYSHMKEAISEPAWQDYERGVQRLLEGQPLAYIIGVKEFWSLDLEVNENTLIPRPETELLVQLVLDHLPKHDYLKIADLGTGSGAIAVALASERPHWQIHATDISAAALKVANRNVLIHFY